MCSLAEIIISGWPDDIKEVPQPLHLYWQHYELLTIEDGLVFCREALIITPSEREKVLVLCTSHTKALSEHSCLLAHGCVFWPGINTAIKEAAWQCETCMRFQAQNAAAPLTPRPTPSYPWQICASDIFTLDGVDYLILANFSSKVILVCNLSAGQSNSAKVIHILEEWFCDHGTPEALHIDNGPQYTSAAFTDCNIEWVSSMKPPVHTIQWICQVMCKNSLAYTATCQVQWYKPRIALQHLKATPVDAKLPQPSHMLYNHKIIPLYHLGSII